MFRLKLLVIAFALVGIVVGIASGFYYYGYKQAASRNHLDLAMECPVVEGVDTEGYVWVQKAPHSSWGGGTLVPGALSEGTFATAGRANIGQAVVEFLKPGTYTFLYKVDPRGGTLITALQALQAFVFPEEALVKKGFVTKEEIVAHSVYAYKPDSPLYMTFTIDKLGIYRIAYGPAQGIYAFKEWLQDWRNRHNSQYHMRLGLQLVGDPTGYRWIHPERPVDIWVWRTPDQIFLEEDEIHARLFANIRCPLDLSKRV